MDQSLSLIIPAYNEAENILATLENVTEALAGLPIDYEVIVIDDASKDGTGNIVQSNLHRFPHVKLLVNEKNRGFGGTYRRGVESASKENVVMVHGDNAWPAHTLRKLFSKLGLADVIIGYTKDMWQSRTIARALTSKIFTLILNLLTGRWLQYYNGLQIHKTSVLKDMNIESSGFGFQAEVLIKGLRQTPSYVQVPMELTERQHGQSTAFRWKNFVDVARTLKLVARLEKPAWLFLIPALILAGISAWLLWHRLASIGTDGSLYTLLGKNLAQTGTYQLFGKPQLYFSPFLPLIIAFIFRILANAENSAYFSTILFGFTAGPVLYWALKNKVPKSVALLAAIFLTLNGEWLFNYSTSVTPQAIAAVLTIFMFALLLRLPFSKKWNVVGYVILGILNGLAYLTRPEYFYLIGPVLIFIIYALRNYDFKKIITACILTLIGFIIMSGPYLLYLHKNTGSWTISTRSSFLSQTVQNPEPENSGQLYTDVIDKPASSTGFLSAAWHNKSATLKRLLKGLWDAERNLGKMLGLLGIGLATLGLRRALLDKRYRLLGGLALMLLPVTAIALGDIGGATPNYLIQFLPWLLILAAYGLWSLRQESYKWIIGLGAATLLYLFLPVVQAYISLPPDTAEINYKSMGLWMKDHLTDGADQLVLSKKPEFALYSGANWAYTPDLSYPQLNEIMKENNSQYIIVDLSKQSAPEQKMFAPIHSEDSLSLYKAR